VQIVIRNLPFSMTAHDLTGLFTPYGVVAWAVICTDARTGRSRGWGWVAMENPWAALDALAGLQGMVLEGCPLLLSVASTQPSLSAPYPLSR
jgi:RNA recognition motif-containing protein